ncbi:MAG: DUF177 domain-containing protein [Flavobacteriales bacterium]|nr:DUF177 domain-containing protein [Flavobacteriales bacterium]
MNAYKIPFAGLKVGIHSYDFEVDQSFFEHFDYSDIGESAIQIHVDLDRREHMMVFNVVIEGKAKVLCDRCQEEVEISLELEEQLIVKFGDHTSGFDEEIVILGPHEHIFDLTHFFFEFCHLALPPKRVHADIRECNEDVIKVLEEMTFADEQDDTDPRWDALRGLVD